MAPVENRSHPEGRGRGRTSTAVAFHFHFQRRDALFAPSWSHQDAGILSGGQDALFLAGERIRTASIQGRVKASTEPETGATVSIVNRRKSGWAPPREAPRSGRVQW
jgi:hypothetical protein